MLSVGCRAAPPDSESSTAGSVPAAASNAGDSGPAVDRNPTPARVTSGADSTSQDGAQPATVSNTGQQPAPVESLPVGKVDAPASPRQEASEQAPPVGSGASRANRVVGTLVDAA